MNLFEQKAVGIVRVMVTLFRRGAGSMSFSSHMYSFIIESMCAGELEGGGVPSMYLVQSRSAWLRWISCLP